MKKKLFVFLFAILACTVFAYSVHVSVPHFSAPVHVSPVHIAPIHVAPVRSATVRSSYSGSSTVHVSPSTSSTIHVNNVPMPRVTYIYEHYNYSSLPWWYLYYSRTERNPTWTASSGNPATTEHRFINWPFVILVLIVVIALCFLGYKAFKRWEENNIF